MKRARFLVEGRYEEGRLAEPGVLVDAQGRAYREADVRFLPPVAAPGKILGLALNYADHAGELGLDVPADPAIFFKPATALVGHRGAVVYPAGVEYMHYENELAVVLGPAVVPEVPDHVRDFVRNVFRPPVKGKGWDTFLPIGPYLVEDEIADPHALELRTFVNGELRQRGNTADQLTKVPQLIAYLTEFMTLERGDILLTGTPKGLSHIHAGDEMRLEIDGLGALESKVIAEAGRPDQEVSRVRPR